MPALQPLVAEPAAKFRICVADPRRHHIASLNQTNFLVATQSTSHGANAEGH
jgi:hypothetical protein